MPWSRTGLDGVTSILSQAFRYGRLESHGDVIKVQSLFVHTSLDATQAYIYDTTDNVRQAVDSMQSYRSHKGVRILQPKKILEAYGLPMPLIDRILTNNKGLYHQGKLFA